MRSLIPSAYRALFANAAFVHHDVVIEPFAGEFPLRIDLLKCGCVERKLLGQKVFDRNARGEDTAKDFAASAYAADLVIIGTERNARSERSPACSQRRVFWRLFAAARTSHHGDIPPAQIASTPRATTALADSPTPAGESTVTSTSSIPSSLQIWSRHDRGSFGVRLRRIPNNTDSRKAGIRFASHWKQLRDWLQRAITGHVGRMNARVLAADADTCAPWVGRDCKYVCSLGLLVGIGDRLKHRCRNGQDQIEIPTDDIFGNRHGRCPVGFGVVSSDFHVLAIDESLFG